MRNLLLLAFLLFLTFTFITSQASRPQVSCEGRGEGRCVAVEEGGKGCVSLPYTCPKQHTCCAKDTPTPDTPPPSPQTSAKPPPSPQTTSAKPPPMTTTPMPVCVCGLANADRIVGGEEVMPAHKYPWIVGLRFEGGSAHECSGSIINNMYVVTAAHCLYQQTEPFELQQPSDVMVFIADHDQYSSTDDIPGVTMILDVMEITVHPSYDFFGVDNDIALLKLSESLSFDNKAVRPVCLPRNSNDTYEGATATAAGWGLTSEDAMDQPAILMEVNVTILEPDCRGIRINGFDITENMICAGEDEGGLDACDGDSGGPLTVTQDGRYVLVGVTSFGEGCARPNMPGVYTRVNNYLDFIEQTAGGAMFCDYNPFE
ncbi:hypothetical protein Pmani_034654 [Petrolisthes manimaculis]|uniref:Peptidase S1 domain-containing protein n=1 Tax=Petrolisthes manimaculis TaxID=1843537 RepID=A0AAE1TRB7_9EUCA|nr:hypothetical protein Pmani_034654 [Petrolisthes manimaculis]